MKHLEHYIEFDLWDNQMPTRWPISVTYKGKLIDNYQSIDAARADIDAMPTWMQSRRTAIDLLPADS